MLTECSGSNNGVSTKARYTLGKINYCRIIFNGCAYRQKRISTCNYANGISRTQLESRKRYKGYILPVFEQMNINFLSLINF